MSKGNSIIVSSEPRGVFIEGIITGTPKPGTVMQVDVSEDEVGGRLSWEVYNADADGNSRMIAVLLEDRLQGKLMADAYVTGTRGFLYVPAAGEMLNMLVADVGGTADTVTRGQLYIVDDGTGLLVNTTGTPEAESFMAAESAAALTANTHIACFFTGH